MALHLDDHRSKTGIPPNVCAIGLDVGGTKVAAGLVGYSGSGEFKEVISSKVIATRPERGGKAVLVDALELAQQIMEEAETQKLTVAGIGVAVCELVDPAGNITSGHTVDWQGMPVQEEFSELAPAVVDSDARTPAFAEAHLGQARPLTPLLTSQWEPESRIV